MKPGDFLLCTFQGDTASPAIQYVAEITTVDEGNGKFDCELVTTGQQFTFDYLLDGNWPGTDNAGKNYDLATHDVFTGQATDPVTQQAAVVTFSDGKKYLCYVNAVDPAIDLVFYHFGNPSMCIRDGVVTVSQWSDYPVGTSVESVECFMIDNPSASTGVTGGTGPAAAGSYDAITKLAGASPLATYQWKDRGKSPAGYLKGMALTYARVYCKLKSGDAAATEMAKADSNTPDSDALSWYSNEFAAVGMDNSVSGTDTLRHLFVLMIGLGMRESSGKYCEGRDTSAENMTADTAEAGLFQTSFNARSSHSTLPAMFTAYANKTDFLDVFREGVSCSTSNLENFGTGDGKVYQQLAKSCPPFAVEFTAVAMRNRRKHWGPINLRKAELITEADTLLQQVEQLVDQSGLCPVVL